MTKVETFFNDLFEALKEQGLLKELNYEKLIEKQILQINHKESKYIPHETYKDNSLKSKLTEKQHNIDIEELVSEIRTLFKTKKRSLFGSKSACNQNLNWFLKTYPEYADKDLIIKAAKIHLLNAYPRQAHYFIKKHMPDRSVVSDLETCCELALQQQESNDNRYNGATAI